MEHPDNTINSCNMNYNNDNTDNNLSPPSSSSSAEREVGGRTFYCHGCSAEIQPILPDLVCPVCGSEFIEEVESSDPPTQFVATFNDGYQQEQEPGQQEPTPSPQTNAQNQPFSPHPQPMMFNFTGPIPLGQMMQQLTTVLQQAIPQPAAGGPQIIFQQQNVNFPPFPAPFANMITQFMNLNGGELNINIVNNGGFATFGNLGDYMGGANLEAFLNQMFQNATYRGTPPASKTEVESLKRGVIEQGHVDTKTDCAVCKDEFELGNEYVEVPCSHIFHPDCILPWLNMHNSCPVCRYELKTDDPDYEARKSQQQRR
jgi:DNA-directed RNA polymerase subunit RPC12/RpoP